MRTGHGVKTSEIVEPFGNRTTAQSAVLAQLRSIAVVRGYKPGWPAVKFEEIFGLWPACDWVPEPIDPLPALRWWVKRESKRWAKGR